MEVLIKLNNQTNGRDKMARLIQYSARSAWYILHQHKLLNPKSVDNLKSLEYNMATFRKLLRFGRFADNLYMAMFGNMSSIRLIALASSTAKLAYAAFLLCDHIIWIARIGLIDVDTERWSKSSNRYWAITVSLQLLIDVYEIYKVVNSKTSEEKTNKILLRLVCYRKDLVLDTLKNLCDLIIPLTGLGMIRTSPGLVGAVGMLTSVAGLVTLIDPQYKFSVS